MIKIGSLVLYEGITGNDNDVSAVNIQKITVEEYDREHTY